MSQRRFYRPVLRKLTTAELAMLLHKSRNVGRKEQRQYLAQLGGEGTPRELDFFLSLATCDADAIGEACRLDDQLDQASQAGSARVPRSICQAANWFTHAAIRGDFGPGDSRHARAAFFLEQPAILARAVEIFLENLVIDASGVVLNHKVIGERCF